MIQYNEKPPTLYSILESIVNFGKAEDERTKIVNLAKEGKFKIFDFDYPLSPKIQKSDFEEMILNKFIMRRIGFETVTAFKIHLNVKLNEIMPLYNKMFDALDSYNFFDGEQTIRDLKDNRIIENNNTTNSINNISNKQNSNIDTNTTNNTTIDNSTTSDRRHSDTPQDEINNVKAGVNITDYNYDSDTNKTTDKTENKSNSNSTINNTTDNTNKIDSKNNTKDDNVLHEEIKKISPQFLQEFIKNNEMIKNVYTLIFKDLECLFYQLV